MGHRANLLIVRDGSYDIYYCHWCAITLPRSLFWGPARAEAFIRAQNPADEWLDDVWAEGAAVLDLDRKTLLFFGGEDASWDIPLRRELLEMMRRVWRGWEIRWAHDAIADVADYVGYARERVLRPRNRSLDDPSLLPPIERAWTQTVGSLRLAEGVLRLLPLPGFLEYYLRIGSALIDLARANEGLSKLPLDEWMTDCFPVAGFHIDERRRTVEFWTAKANAGVLDRVQTAWPGWKVKWHHDTYEWQAQAADGAVRFPTRSKNELRGQTVQMLLQEYGGSSATQVLEIVETLRKEGKTVEVNNPAALTDVRLELSDEERRRILATSLGDDL